MARQAHLLEQVKAVLDGSIIEGSVIEQIAIQYAEFLNGIQVRVTQGLGLARRGLRMELRSLVDAKPPLLLVLDQLLDSKSSAAQIDDFRSDFEQGKNSVISQPSYSIIEIWRKYCRENNLAISPLINVEHIIEIRVAVSLAYKDRFDQLHRLFRRQNLALASVSMRLDTLRLLAKRDRKNLLWHEEIIRFENELIQELRHSLTISIQNGLLSEAERIMRDLSNGEWRGVAEVQLAVAQCEVQVNAAWAEHAAEHAARLAQEMFANYMAESIDQVRESLVQWEIFLDRMARGGSEVPSEPLSTVTPIIEWLNLRDAEIDLSRETKSRLEALERVTVDPTTSAIDVQACLIAAESILAEVPPALREIAEWRVQAHLAQMKTHRRIKVFLITFLTAAILGFAVWFMMDEFRASRERIFIAALEAAVDRNDSTQVEKLISDSSIIQEGFDQHPSSLAAIKKHADVLVKQAEENKNFEDLFSQAGDPTAISANRSTIEAAANIARTDDQRERVKQWRITQNAVEARDDEARNKAFLEEVQVFGIAIEQLELISPQDIEAQGKLIQLERFSDRNELVQNVSEDAKRAFESLRKRVGALRVEVDRVNEETRLNIAQSVLMDEIMSEISSPEKLSDLLRQFAIRFPTSEYAEDFLAVALNSEQWISVMNWLEIRRVFMKDLIPDLESERKTRKIEIQMFRSKYPKSPLDESLMKYDQLLTENVFWLLWLKNTLKDWQPMLMHQLLLKDDFRYFYGPGTPQKVTKSNTKVFSAWADLNYDSKLPLSIPLANIKFDGVSPQEDLKVRLEAFLYGRGAKNSPETGLETIRMIRDSVTVEPVLRATLIGELLPKIQTSLPYLKKPFEQSIQLLADANLDEIDWIKPGIPSNRKDFKRISQILLLDIQVEDWLKLQRDQIKNVNEWLKCDLRSVGIIDQFAVDQRIRFSPTVRLRPTDFLYVVTNNSRIAPIGTVDASGIPQVDARARSYPNGTPVFSGSYRPVTMFKEEMK